MTQPKSRGSHSQAAALVRQLPTDLSTLDGLVGDSLGLFCWADVRPLRGVLAFVDWRLCGDISQALVSGLFRGERDEVMLMPVKGRMGPRRLFLFGLGPQATYQPEVLRETCANAHAIMCRAGMGQVVLGSPQRPGDATIAGTFLRAVQEQLAGKVGHVLVDK